MTDIKDGLILKEPDPKNYKFHKVFGSAQIGDLPDFFVTNNPLRIKDQKDTDRCTGYGFTAVSEDQEGIELNPEFQFFVTKVIQGNDGYGAGLEDVAKSAIEYGSLPQSMARYDANTPRETILDSMSWTRNEIDEAKKHAKGSYLEVKHNDFDMFDSVRSALWLGKENKQSILTGANWRSDWTSSPDGQIPTQYGTNGNGHCFKIFGWNKDNLICQLSNGKEIGDNGLFYMPREVANRELKFGCLYFSDLDKYEAKWRQHFPVWLARILGKIEKFFKTL